LIEFGGSFVKQTVWIITSWFCLIDFEQAKLFSKEEEKTTKKKKKVLFIAGCGKNARLFR
jgi:hypothetical protein